MVAIIGIIGGGPHKNSILGMFFVRKKDGSQRFIFDTRVANCHFRKPPRTHLPTAAALSSVECSPDDED